MQRYFIQPQLWTRMANFATLGLALLAPCAANATKMRALDCEISLLYPMSTLISPVIHERPLVKEIIARHSGLKEAQTPTPRQVIHSPPRKLRPALKPPRPPHWKER